MALSFNDKCRICLSKNDTMHSLFGNAYNEYSLADIIGQGIDSEVFKIQENDGLSSLICETCTDIIINFINLKATYETNLNYLKHKLNNHNKLENNNSKHQKYEKNKSEEISILPSSKSNRNYSIVKIEDLSEFELLNDDFEGETFVITQGDCNLASDPKTELSSSNEIANCEMGYMSDAENEVCSNDAFILKEGKTNKKSVSWNKNHNVFKTEKMSTDKDEALFELQEYSKYSCPCCFKFFYNFVHFRLHMEEHHETYNVTPDMYCSPIRIKVKKNIGGNLERPENFECRTCGEIFTDADICKNHEVIHKKYICECCGMRFKRKSYLTDHMEIHGENRNYVCKVCNKAFKRRAVFSKHSKIHSKDAKVICEYCGRSFMSKCTMKTHVQLIHIRERNYQCLICGLKFSLKSTLNKHILRHDKNREKHYICQICNSSYKDNYSLKRHNIMKHSEQPIKLKCEFCDKHYTSITNLKRHKARHHKAILNTS